MPDEQLEADARDSKLPLAVLLVVLVGLVFLQIAGHIQEQSEGSRRIKPSHASVAQEQLSELEFDLYIDDPEGSARQLSSVAPSIFRKRVSDFTRSLVESEAAATFELER